MGRKVESDTFEVIDGFHNQIGVVIKQRVTEEAKKFIRKNHFDYLILDHTEPGGMKDLGVLVDNKEKIVDLRINNDDVDWDCVNQLTSIRILKVGGWFNCNGLDFRKLPNLVYLETDWNSGYEDTLKDLKQLRCLELRGCKSESLEGFGKMPKLEFFQMTYSRTPKTLSGIQSFRSLKNLELIACSNLTDISALEACKKLQLLHIENCNRFLDGSSIADLKTITHLRLFGKMKTLQWLQDMKKLYSLRFDCKLDDGNLDFLYKMKNLKFIDFANKKNLSVKNKDIRQFLEEKGFDQEEAWDDHGLSFPDPIEFV